VIIVISDSSSQKLAKMNLVGLDKEVADKYRETLSTLSFNNKIVINTLTEIAKEEVKHAEVVTRVIEERLKKVKPDGMLPLMYLIDSICKNIGGPYNELFQQNLVSNFTYALAIYHLNLLLAFLTPKIDPAMAEYEADEDGPGLPTSQNEEFRPFIRRLPEFKFWYSATKATTIAFFCTFFELFNIPVFWPILVMYFITLFCITMKRQIKHMIRYRYIPFTFGKPKFEVS